MSGCGGAGAGGSNDREDGSGQGGGGVRAYLKTLVNRKTVRFAAARAGTYALLSGACYLVYVLLSSSLS